MIQLVVVRKITASHWTPPNQNPGDVVWVNTEAGARHLIENGFCELPKAKEVPAAAVKVCRRSESWPLDRFAVVRRVWEGATVVCIGGGPSVTPEAVALAKGRARTIAINNSYLLAPWADLCYFADTRWWNWHKDRPEFKNFAGEKVTIEPTGLSVADPEVSMLHNDNLRGETKGLSEKPNALRTGSNGGYQAINLAVLAGAKRILLLGYDMKFDGKRSHWHAGHPEQTPEAAYRQYAQTFASMNPQLSRLGVDVVNCTPGSMIKAFRFSDLATELSK